MIDLDIPIEIAEQQETARRKQVFEEYIKTPEYMEKLVTRLQVNDACTNSANSADARKYAWNLCHRPDNTAEGLIFFVENFGYTFDPRPHTEMKHLPFILFDYQKQAIRWMVEHIEGGKDGLIEKSRDMGVTWIVFVYVPLYYWLFRDGINILEGSYKERLVDDRSKDSLFGMLDYAIDSLPKWLLPSGFNKEKHRTQMKLINPVTGNIISGDTMNPDFGRGTRKTVVLFDEHGSWDYAKDAWESAGDSTSCRISNSTPKGYNFYATLRNSGIDLLTLHWKLHPLKDEAWYQFEKRRRTEEEVAQELDISYNKSQEGRVYPEWNEINVEQGLFEYDDEKPLYVGWDYGGSDDTAIIWAQPGEDRRLRIIDTYRNTKKIIDFYIPFVTGFVGDGYTYTKDELEMISRHSKWRRGIHFGDPSGRFTNQVTNTTIFKTLANYGIVTNFRDEWKNFQKRRTAGKLRIQEGILLNDNKRTQYFNLCMLNASYPVVKNKGMEEVRSILPKHDYTSHYRSAFEYLCLGLSEFNQVRREIYDKFKKKDGEVKKKNRVLGY